MDGRSFQKYRPCVDLLANALGSASDLELNPPRNGREKGQEFPLP